MKSWMTAKCMNTWKLALYAHLWERRLNTMYQLPRYSTWCKSPCANPKYRLKKVTEPQVDQPQSRFRIKRSTHLYISTMKRLGMEWVTKQMLTFMLFLLTEEACNRVSRKKLYTETLTKNSTKHSWVYRERQEFTSE